MGRSKRDHRLFGILCVALGFYPLAISLGIVPASDTRVHAPMWVIALGGVVFIIAGCMMLLANHSRANDLLASVLCAVFGIIGIWVAIFGPGESFSGGLPFVPHNANVGIARWVLGGGALICLVISGYALRRSFGSVTKQQLEVDK